MKFLSLSNTVLSNLLIETFRKDEVKIKRRCQNQGGCSALLISRGSGKHPSQMREPSSDLNAAGFIWGSLLLNVFAFKT